jgi:hypothetical protein
MTYMGNISFMNDDMVKYFVTCHQMLCPHGVYIPLKF